MTMADYHFTFVTYAAISTLSVLALLTRTWYVHEELYTIVAVLTTQKVSLAILYNFAFMFSLGIGKVVLRVLLGQLRDLEVEQVLDSGRGFLLDTVLFLVLSSPTLDGVDVSTYALARFLLFVVALKTAHLVVQIRGATMFEVGHPRVAAIVRICVVLSAMLSVDVFAVHFFFTNASRRSTFYLWLLFECLGMLTACAICIMKFAVHLVDARLDNGWTSKSAVIFYLELLHDVTSLLIFLLFMAVFFITQPSRLPLYMTADIIHVVKALYKRILSLKKYRSLTRNLETRFPDATHDELEAADTCIICRDLLYEGSKKLPCSHIFHIDCLRSWLVQQQSCPTCRADIPTEDTAASAGAAAAASSESGSQSQAGTSSMSAPPPSSQQELRGGGSLQVVQQQQQYRGSHEAISSVNRGGPAGMIANDRAPALATEEGLSQRSEETTTLSASAAGAAPSAVVGSAVCRRSTRTTAANFATDEAQNTQAYSEADPPDQLSSRMKRSSSRVEAADAAATPGRGGAPSASAPKPPCNFVGYGEEVETAIRLRVAQAEAVITNTLAQMLAMSYQMCDLYRLHASLWTAEAQRAQLEACHVLLQSRNSCRASPAMAHAGSSAGEHVRSASRSSPGFFAVNAHSSLTDAPKQLLPRAAGVPASSAAVSRLPGAVDQPQSEPTPAENGAGVAAVSEKSEKVLVAPLSSLGASESLLKRHLQATSSSDTALGSAAAAAGTKDISAMRSCAEAAGALKVAVENEAAGELGRERGRHVEETDLRQNSGRDYVVVCPSHLFHQTNLPNFLPFSINPAVPPLYEYAADGPFVGDDSRVRRAADPNYTVVSGTDGSSNSNNDNRSKSSGTSPSASTSRPSTGNALSPQASEYYGSFTGAGHYSVYSPWTGAASAWQSMRSGLTNGPQFFPPFSPLVELHPEVAETAAAAQQRVRPPRNSAPAAAVEQGMTVHPAARSAFPFTPHTVPAHADASARSSAIKAEETFRDFQGYSPLTPLPEEEKRSTATTTTQTRREVAESTLAEGDKAERDTSAMLVELETVRKEQHQRWKQGGNASTGVLKESNVVGG